MSADSGSPLPFAREEGQGDGLLNDLYRLGWFSTGRDRAARDLLSTVRDAIERREIDADIAFVFCSREPGDSAESDLFIRQVRDYGIPLVCFSYRRFRERRTDTSGVPKDGLPPWRFEYDRAVVERLSGFQPDLCVLAGYMLIVTREMCERYTMVNLHPAAPGGPSGTWQEVVWKLLDSGASETGVMMHLVTPELDKGPPVTFCTFSIRGGPFDRYWQEYLGLPQDSPERHSERNPLFQLIRRHGLAREFPLIVATIRAFSEGRVRVVDGRVADERGKTIPGYDLTDEIERAVKGIL